MMRSDLDGVLETIGEMEKLELAAAKFYRACAGVWLGHKALWESLIEEEAGHTNNLKRMAELVAAKPELFQRFRPFNVKSVQTAVAGLEKEINAIEAGGCSLTDVLAFARDFEQSLMEMKYGEIVKTADIEYQTLVKGLMSETLQHKGKICDLIAKLKC
jgi:rubrerythrin